MYEIYQNTMCVNGGFLYKADNPIMTLSQYKNLIYRYAKTLRPGGNGRTALIDFQSIPDRWRKAIVKQYGDPFKKDNTAYITSQLEVDLKASEYFASFKLPDGRHLPETTQREYFTNAQILNLVDKLVCLQKTQQRIFGKTRLTALWQKMAEAITLLDADLYPHTLPNNPRSLERKLKQYKAKGYAALVHKNFGNGHAAKIEGDVADWILATYCLPVKINIAVLHNQYMRLHKGNQWPSLTESAISMYLDKPEVKRIWTLARHGKDAFVNKFQHHTKRDRSHWFPNVHWAMDGTKLDWVHLEDTALGMAAKLKINVIIDVYSEKILGWSYSETEDHTDHFTALKMAFKNAETKPYLLTYDNQSGHKSSRMQELYTKAVAKDGGTHHPHKAYAKNNPIEQVFNRLQQQCVNMWWFNDGQTIKARKEDNRPNMDFLLENKTKLLTKDKLEQAWIITVDQWNAGIHPHFESLTRTDVYNQPAPMADAVSFLDMIDMFWIATPKTITYNRGGLLMRLANKEYEFEVYDENNRINTAFRTKYTGAKFTVKYDPEEMDNYVRLYITKPDGKMEYVANAQPKRAHETIPALMQEGDKAAWYDDYEVRGEELATVEKDLQALRARTGITPEKLIADQDLLIKMGGRLPKDQRNKVEADDFLSRL
ncbi:MAG: transposase family protein [Flavobacteriaceae bacterium]|nr:transposase family protein [Flavobacteriaceae bacterium]